VLGKNSKNESPSSLELFHARGSCHADSTRFRLSRGGHLSEKKKMRAHVTTTRLANKHIFEENTNVTVFYRGYNKFSIPDSYKQTAP